MACWGAAMTSAVEIVTHLVGGVVSISLVKA
jgi:hypothetical protein